MYVPQSQRPIVIPPTDRIITDARALIRLQSDHIGRTLVPSFYRYLQAQDSEKQVAGGREFHQAIETLVGLFERATTELGNDPKLKKHLGLYAGGELGLADVLVAPCTCHLSELFSEWGKFHLCIYRDIQSNERAQALPRV